MKPIEIVTVGSEFESVITLDSLRNEAREMGMRLCEFSLHFIPVEEYIEDEAVCKDCLRKIEIMKIEDYPNNYILNPEIILWRTPKSWI